MRETIMDGSLHIEGDCCQYRRCYTCGAVRHFQGIYAGYMEACERCPSDAEYWKPEGTHCRECEYDKAECARRNCALKAYYPARWNAIQRWWLTWIAFWEQLPEARDPDDEFFVPLKARHANCAVCGTL